MDNFDLKIKTKNEKYNKTSNILFWFSFGFLFLLIGVWFGNLKLKENIIINDIDILNPENKKEKLLKNLLNFLNIFEFISIILSFGLFLSFYIYTLGTEHNKQLKDFLLIFGIIIILLYSIIYVSKILIFFYSSIDISLTLTLNTFYIGMVLLLALAMVVKFIGVAIYHCIIRKNERKMLNEHVNNLHIQRQRKQQQLRKQRQKTNLKY